ncbi:MAG: glycosyltransferase family 4 protein [Minisyncoccia bacterium]
MKFKHLIFGPEISIFHEFHKPPYGGGNQFLLALTKELIKKGYDVGANKIGRKTKVVMFNSFNFDFDKLSILSKKYKTRMIHRLAGPIGIYRGTDIEIDRNTEKMNATLANATIFISQYSADKYKEIGLNFKNPFVILNSTDPDLFNSQGRISSPNKKRKIRLIATAWSNNPKKGGPLLSWLDEHLDHSRFELTFVGRTTAKFKGAKLIEPVPSKQLAEILKQQDIYIAPSEDDPCSNALIEALACGLPAVYRKSGGHPEIVKNAGEGFTDGPTALEAIDLVAQDIEKYRGNINIPTLEETANKYISILLSNEYK